jgi:hypothetical protein
MVEGWVRNALTPVGAYRNVKAWRKEVDMLVDVASRASGNSLIVVTKVWVGASPAELNAWRQYALGTFLLGYSPGHAYFSFRSNHKLTHLPSITGIDLGIPSGAYFVNGKAFQRNFATGTVVVNPGKVATTVGLGGIYLTPAGVHVSVVRLRPHSAAILTLP